MEFNEVIKNRCATRKFSKEKVSKEKLNRILEAGRLAPTAKNIQPIKIFVIENNLEKLDDITPCRYGAQTVLLICGSKSEAYQKENHMIWEIDATIVATHLVLAATNEGVDNILVERFDDEKLLTNFNISKNYSPVLLIPIGYRTSDCPDSPNHNKRKLLSELVEYR